MGVIPLELDEVKRRAARYYHDSARELASSVDRMMSWLLVLEWFGLVGVGLHCGPFGWNLVAPVLSGPLLVLPVVICTLRMPGRQFTRHAVAVAQMLLSTLLIDITGGMAETRFHVFGSLAFLALYRDWKVLLTASLLSGLDHLARGIWWPLPEYGAVTLNPLPWLEHIGWVVFEDFFLIIASARNKKDMREVALVKAQLYEGAYHDVLTGLANRRLLAEHFAEFTSQGLERSRAVLFLDLDRFKQVNDTLGHTVGDKLLASVALRLKGCLENRHLLARVGGDEFVILLDTADDEGAAMVVGHQLLHCMTKPFEIDGHSLLLSASVGISLYPQQGLVLEVLQTRADQAMYVAKSRGRNQVALYSHEVVAQGANLQELARDLYRALPNRELHLVFQPIFDHGCDISGFEALLRWSHPRLGLISPAVFIPMAERSASIIAIGDWVLLEACQQCKTWQRRNRQPMRVAVNVSAVQFELPDFPARVKRALDDSGLDPDLLTLELTEGVLMKDLAQTRQQLSELRGLGIQVSIDDFGTGYSSLTYLAQLPADIIKLDCSFVYNEFLKPSTLLDSIIQMAHRIGLHVVAEGVENPAQADWLLSMDCDSLQGFSFSHPMHGETVESYIESRQQTSEAISQTAQLARLAHAHSRANAV